MIKQLGPGLSFEMRDNKPWLVFKPQNGGVGQINLDILTSRTFTAPNTSAAINAWVKETLQAEREKS